MFLNLKLFSSLIEEKLPKNEILFFSAYIFKVLEDNPKLPIFLVKIILFFFTCSNAALKWMLPPIDPLPKELLLPLDTLTI